MTDEAGIKGNAADLQITTLHGARTNLALVQLLIPQADWYVQMTLDEAYDLAMKLIQSIAGARADAMLIFYLRDMVGLEPEQVGAALAYFREMREEIEKMEKEGD